jgi:hypothetical protein
MKLLSYAVPLLILLLSFFYNTNPFIVSMEARQAFLNLDTTRFRWNDSLTREAESRALNMANRLQNNSVLKNGTTLEFRLVGAASCAEAIQQFLAMKEVENLGTPVHIGMGYARSDAGKNATYTCIMVSIPPRPLEKNTGRP